MLSLPPPPPHEKILHKPVHVSSIELNADKDTFNALQDVVVARHCGACNANNYQSLYNTDHTAT